MSRKFRSTEISGKVNISTNGQHMHYNWICLGCDSVGSYADHIPHKNNCSKDKNNIYSIPAEAEVPKRSASNRVWNIFKKQFVYAKPVGWWWGIEYSWWRRNKNKNK